MNPADVRAGLTALPGPMTGRDYIISDYSMKRSVPGRLLRRPLFLAVLSAIVLFLPSACRGTADPVSPPAEETFEVRLSASVEALTRGTVAATAAESAVHNVDWLVYDNVGSLVTPLHRTGEGVSETSVNLPRGTYRFVALVNYPSLDEGDVSTVAKYRSLPVDFISTAGASTPVFVMRSDIVERSVGSNTTVELSAKRTGCKVVLNGGVSSIEFSDNYRSVFPDADDIVVRSVFLINIPSVTRVSDGEHLPVSSVMTFDRDWYGVTDLSGVPVDITSSEWYCHPNTEAEASDISGEDHVTKLVIRGKYGFYPLGFPGLKQNECVVIDKIFIDGKGSSRPNEYIPDVTTVKFRVVSLEDWVVDTDELKGVYEGYNY